MDQIIYRLEQARKMKGLSLRQAAEQITATGFKLSHEALRKYETGKIKMDSNKLIAFANFYDVTIDYLVPKPARPIVFTKMQFHKIRLPH